MESEIIVFTQEGCIYCKKQKEWLSQNNIKYQEKNVDKDDEYRLELLKRKIMGVPYTIIRFLEDNEKEVVVGGFDVQKLERLLLEY
ncbi:glutaredoxin family protein [Priestia megaterium]|uniref:glutaredoxin family protein n=1 Tax=Priestia megaterium TaxID=1404 RepID=UPI001BE8643F|nr:glutaredoxin family protein [Priestia megaterium]MBT2259177.1 glutaredoxin family protein [Priestia megaterium]MBT2279768.1 glutaredoxin family protein [Priestia megaterium]